MSEKRDTMDKKKAGERMREETNRRGEDSSLIEFLPKQSTNIQHHTSKLSQKIIIRNHSTSRIKIAKKILSPTHSTANPDNILQRACISAIVPVRVEERGGDTSMSPQFNENSKYQDLEIFGKFSPNITNKLGLSWAKLNSSFANYARCASCFARLSYM